MFVNVTRECRSEGEVLLERRGDFICSLRGPVQALKGETEVA